MRWPLKILHEDLGGRGLLSLEPFDVMHLKARVIRMNLKHERMVAFFSVGPLSFFAVVVRRISFFLSVTVEVDRTAARIHQLGH